MAATDGAVVYAIRLQAEGQPIGAIGYEASQLSYFVDPEHWGTGVASEAVGAICAALRDNGVDRLYASVVRSNVASQRVLERNGFMFDGLEPGGDGGAISSLEAHIRKTPKLRYLARLA
jgi:RimJ/RimL family protein N-acetyltransferase